MSSGGALFRMGFLAPPPRLNLRRVSGALTEVSARRFRGGFSRVRGTAQIRNRAARMVLEEEVDPGEVVGTNLRILRYPHPLLRVKNEKVSAMEFGDEIKSIAKEMLLVMYASRGVGLAAPQVGINKRLMVFNPEGDPKAWVHEVVLVNPRIIATSKASDVEREGCLSFPEMSGEVRRKEWVKVEGYRPNGKKFKVKYEGWTARVFQHEYDHLDGVLYIDRLEESSKPTVQPRLEQLIEEYKAEPYEGLEPAI